jgi:hypothetical protein
MEAGTPTVEDVGQVAATAAMPSPLQEAVVKVARDSRLEQQPVTSQISNKKKKFPGIQNSEPTKTFY